MMEPVDVEHRRLFRELQLETGKVDLGPLARRRVVGVHALANPVRTAERRDKRWHRHQC